MYTLNLEAPHSLYLAPDSRRMIIKNIRRSLEPDEKHNLQSYQVDPVLENGTVK